MPRIQHHPLLLPALVGWTLAAGLLVGGLERRSAARPAAGPPCDPCPADTNADGGVDVTDLLAVLAAWGTCTDLDCDGFTVLDGDCDDSDPSVNPAADEFCNGIDDDCDLQVDEDAVDGSPWWPDADADTYGDASATPVFACNPPPDTVDNGDDCDDENPDVHPAAIETCGNGIDDNCDGRIDEACP
jgi:hypothetical protein